MTRICAGDGEQVQLLAIEFVERGAHVRIQRELRECVTGDRKTLYGGEPVFPEQLIDGLLDAHIVPQSVQIRLTLHGAHNTLDLRPAAMRRIVALAIGLDGDLPGTRSECRS